MSKVQEIIRQELDDGITETAALALTVALLDDARFGVTPSRILSVREIVDDLGTSYRGAAGDPTMSFAQRRRWQHVADQVPTLLEAIDALKTEHPEDSWDRLEELKTGA